MLAAEPEVVAGVGGDAGEAQVFVIGVGFAQKGVQGEDAGAFGLAQDAALTQYGWVADMNV